MSRSTAKPKPSLGLRGGARKRTAVDEVTARKLEALAEIEGGGAAHEPAAETAPDPAPPLLPTLHSVPVAPVAANTALPPAAEQGQAAGHRWQGTITRPHRRRDGVATRVCQYHLPVDLAKQVKMGAAERDMSQSAFVAAVLRRALSGL